MQLLKYKQVKKDTYNLKRKLVLGGDIFMGL